MKPSSQKYGLPMKLCLCSVMCYVLVEGKIHSWMHFEKKSCHSNTLGFSIILCSNSSQSLNMQDNVSPYRVGTKAYTFPEKSRIIFGRCSWICRTKYSWNLIQSVFDTKFGNTPPVVKGIVKNVMYLVEAVRLLLKYIGKPQCCVRQKS